MQWGINRSSFIALSYCNPALVYGIHIVWSLLSNAEVFVSLMQCIWQEQKNQCFEDSERKIMNLNLLFFKTLLDWMSIVESHSISSIYDLMDACNLCS